MSSKVWSQQLAAQRSKMSKSQSSTKIGKEQQAIPKISKSQSSTKIGKEQQAIQKANKKKGK